jgi:hypothetical protein
MPSAKSVRIPLTAAMIAFLLLRIAHAAQRAIQSPLTFVRLVRANLMQFRTIHDLATPQPPPPCKASTQLDLVFC